MVHNSLLLLKDRSYKEPSLASIDGVDLFDGATGDLSLFFCLIALLPQVPGALCTGVTITILKVNGL